MNKQGIVLTITSGKGGVGKSTATANLGIGLANKGKRVVMIDFDIGLRNLDMILGLENRIVYDVIDVMEGVCKISQALIAHKKVRELYFLPASQTKDKDILDLNKVKNLIASLKIDFDYIIIDSPAGIESGFHHAIVLADMALIIVTPDVSSVRDSDRVIGIIDAKSQKAQEGDEVKKFILINRLQPDLVANKEMLSPDDILDILSLPLIGIIPEDNKVISATNKGEPTILSKSISGEAYDRVSSRILGDNIPIHDFQIQKSLFGSFKNLFKTK